PDDRRHVARVFPGNAELSGDGALHKFHPAHNADPEQEHFSADVFQRRYRDFPRRDTVGDIRPQFCVVGDDNRLQELHQRVHAASASWMPPSICASLTECVNASCPDSSSPIAVTIQNRKSGSWKSKRSSGLQPSTEHTKAT